MAIETPPATIALSAHALTKHFGSRLVLDGLDLEVARGEIVAVIGESGAGKSTLLNLLAGLETSDGGAIAIEGVDLAHLDERARSLARRRLIGFVFQAFHLLPYFDVAGNVELPLRLLDWPLEDRRARVQAMLEAMGLADRAPARTHQLSGGELQRVALARALAHRPALVLADEPTGNLDARTAREVLDLLLREIRANHATGLIVTHSHQAAMLCDRVVRIIDGRAFNAS